MIQAATKITSPVMRYHGGKFRLAPWVMSFFPEHSVYVEPFGGAAGVMLQKPKSVAEVYNDLDTDVVNVFRVLQCPESSQRLAELLALTPYARPEFEVAYLPTSDPVEQARRTLIRAHMGFGSAGATKGKTGFRSDSRRSYGTASHIWAKFPPKVAAFCERFAGVIIENRPAAAVIETHDSADTLFFVDPPYLHSTRCDARTSGGRHYNHEMSDDDHAQLLFELTKVRGFVALSGYPADFYADRLSGWEMVSTESRISAGRGTGLRTECLWLNPRCAEAQKQGRLFTTAGDPA